jgi:uncharacterized protein YdhG (YjbR/CyaY superfamily)
MKKTTSVNRNSASKDTDATDAVEQYLAAVPEPARTTLNKIRAIIRSAAPPEATEAIGYGMPTFRYKGALMGFAAFKNHCSLFPMNSSLIEAYKDDLKNFRTAKGTIQFPLDKPLPAALVKKLVKVRVAQNEQKKP